MGRNAFMAENELLIAHEVREQYVTIFNNKQKFNSPIPSLGYDDLKCHRVDLKKLGYFLSTPYFSAV